MYKILIADNDNETEECIEKIFEQHFAFDFEIKVAKTGRQAIELAEVFCPDIFFVDLQIPGINGIEVMKEVRNLHKNVNMVIVSASTKFDYVKEAIGIGILEYIEKPLNNEMMMTALKKIFLKVDIEKEKRRHELEMKEKMEMITPIIENDFINCFLYGTVKNDNLDSLCELLEVREKTGYLMLLQYGDLVEEQYKNIGRLSVHPRNEYAEIKYIIKKYFQGAIASMLERNIVVFVPQKKIAKEKEMEFCNCIKENAKKMMMECKKSFRLKFKLGFGRIYEINSLSLSYDEAKKALEHNVADSVVHINDLPILYDFIGNYPMNIETKLFKSIEIGNVKEAIYHAKEIFGWCIKYYKKEFMEIKMKVLECVLYAETIGIENGYMEKGFSSRGKYLKELIEMNDSLQLQYWFEEKIIQVCKNIQMVEEEDSIDIVKRAKAYIQLNYAKEIDLNEVSAHLHISPYYFSKLFKKKTGKNFIEYLTQVRMNHAKSLLKNSTKSMKEICIDIGYSDANYFSRTFKKNIGISPTEYKKEKYGA